MIRFVFLFSVAALFALPSRAQNYAFSTVAGTPFTWETVDGPASTARLGADALASDAAGNVYFADSRANTIRKIAPDGTVSTFAGAAGQAGDANGPVAVARFNRPIDLAFDASGNLYVADAGNFVVRKITRDGVVSTLAGSGAIAEQDGTGAAAQFGYLVPSRWTGRATCSFSTPSHPFCPARVRIGCAESRPMQS